MGLAYSIDREAGTVTVYPELPPVSVLRSVLPQRTRHDREHGTELDEQDLITLLSDLQAGQADLADLSGLDEFAPKSEVGES